MVPNAAIAAKMKRRPYAGRRFAEDYRDPDLQNQDRPLSEDGQPVSGRVGLPPEWQQQDSRDSYEFAIKAIGERVKAGAEIPSFLRSRKDGIR